MASRLARKVRRTGKTAVQFRFSSKFEYIDLQLNGTWRPDKLRVIWLRSHRRAQTTEVHWVAKTDSGPNGAEGRAVFDPPITAALLVTLYRDAKKTNFDSKEYKYFIENEGPNGKKILASITVDLSEYAGMPSSRHPLELTCKSVSKKVNEAIIGTTIESEFIKQGDSNDDDMQSTFSAISAGQGSIVFDEEDDEDLDEAATMDHSHQSNGILSSTPTKAGASSPKSVHSVQSSDSPKSTNPFDSPKTTNPFDEPEEEPATISVRDIWLPGLELVDHNEASVHIERVEKACVIGLYFSAQWCPPCHRFLPRLTKFYNIMKENSRAFEVIYVTSDNTRAEAFEYMEEKQMPWPAIPHGHPLLDKLKEDYKIKSIPMLTIVATSNGEQIDENGKKSVEGAGSPSSAMKLFSKWLEKAGISPEEEVERGKKGLICTVKKAFHACDQPSSRSKSIDKEHREQVQAAKPRKTKSSSNHDQCAALLLEKDEKIRDLHEKNSALEQTNKDLNEETVELKKKIQDLENRLEFMQKSAHDLEAEQERMKAQTELAGWLCKRGVRGPTANVWRRRYFRLDQGSKLYYYKTGTEGTPQGFIDLMKVVDVNEVSAAQQDKNHATFHVLVEGRTFQLLAIDEPTMKKWMEAITYLKNYYQKRS